MRGVAPLLKYKDLRLASTWTSRTQAKLLLCRVKVAEFPAAVPKRSAKAAAVRYGAYLRTARGLHTITVYFAIRNCVCRTPNWNNEAQTGLALARSRRLPGDAFLVQDEDGTLSR